MTDDIARQQMQSLFGDSSAVAVPLGSTIRFRKRDQPQRSGILLHVQQPTERHGMILVVNCGDGMPVFVRLDERTL